MSKLYLVKIFHEGRVGALRAFSSEKARAAYMADGKAINRQEGIVVDSWDDFSRWARCIVCEPGYECRLSRPQRRSIAWQDGARGRADFFPVKAHQPVEA